VVTNLKLDRMCGIWAIFGYHGDTMELFPSFQKIRGRGPDCYRIENINHYKNCCLGFHRLAIVGDKDGMQPVRVKQFPHLWCLTNGEIYNSLLVGKEFGFDYQTTCDIECILHLYNKFGMVGACQQLEGVFATLLMDTISKKVFICRDTYGVRPAFYLQSAGGLLGVSSEVKGLIAVQQNLGDSNFKVMPVPPGSVMEFDLQDDGTCQLNNITRFHDIGSVPRYRSTVMPDPQQDTMANVRNLLEAAVNKRLQSERRIGCLLSGGLDSSLVTGLLCQQLKQAGVTYPLQTFSIGMADSVDVLAARRVAAHLGTEHHEVNFSPEEGIAAVDEVIRTIESYDVTTIRASVGMYLVSKFVNENTDTTIIFSGEGADELCQGYIYFHKQPSAESGDEESRRLLQDLHYYDVLRCDRTISFWGLEARVPFLDHRLGNYFLSLPREERCPRENVEKYLLRKSFSGTGLIPEDIIWRPKEAFSDGVSSRAKSWYEILQESIDSQVSDDMLNAAAEKYPVNTPYSKESYYYRQVFSQHYPDHDHLIPYLWMPKWTPGANDPSARTLQHYDANN